MFTKIVNILFTPKILFIFLLFFIFFFYNDKNKKNKENFIVKNKEFNVKRLNSPLSCIYNIDKQCNNPNISKYLDWKCWYNKNQNLKKNSIMNDNYFSDTIFTDYLKNTKLKYDGIFDLEHK